MRLSTAGSLALCLASVQAFKNTSPFFLFSTSENLPKVDVKQLQSNHDILQKTTKLLESCPSKHYYLVSQENASVTDFSSQRAVPILRRTMKNERIKSVFNVAEVVDQSTTDTIQDFLLKNCNAELEIYEGLSNVRDDSRSKKADAPKITRLNLQGLPSTEPSRSSVLADHDSYFKVIFDTILADADYTVIYTTTPGSPASADAGGIRYESSFQDTIHVELKRQNDFVPRATNYTASGPLFETYQFLTPGIFMGLITVFFLVTILGVGLNALSSLQVSYGAFDKEMGPATSKKQQ